MKKIIYAILCITVILTCASSFTVNAATSGTIGGCQWKLNKTVLTISGDGELRVGRDNVPWAKDSVTELKINEGVTSIAMATFSDYTSLKKVSLPSSMKSLGHLAFSNCTSLTQINLPDGLTTIDDYVFSNCSALVDITIPKTVTTIGIEVFSDCYLLKNIFVNAENEAYRSVDGVLYTKDMSVLVKYPLDKSGQTYTVPSGVKEIAWGAFEAAWDLVEIKLPDTITRICPNAFLRTVPYNESRNVYGGCIYLGKYLIDVKDTEITSCVVKEDTLCIAQNAFSGCDKLRTVILPQNITSIDDSTFAWCGSLESIYIPKSVTSIEMSAFYDCNAIQTVYYSGSIQDRNKITSGIQNETLFNAVWHYDSCHGGNEHVFESTLITQSPTCSAQGNQASVCSVCDAVVTKALEAAGHNFGQWSRTKEPTCNSVGKEERSCNICNAVDIRDVDVLGHVYGPWSVDIDASCDDVGVKRRTCVICQGLEAANIEPKGHIYGKSKTQKRPTFTDTGLSSSVCEVCGDVESTVIDKSDPTALIAIICITVPAALAGVITYLIVKKRREE